MKVTVRLVREDDAATLAALLRANRDFLAPWEPAREDEYFTEARQRHDLAQALAQHQQGRTVPYVILEGNDIVGRITINDIVRGAFQSAHLGYWVRQASNGRGVATAAVAAVVDAAFNELELHRLQGDTLVHNVGSQRVLARNGFSRIGLAPRYLRIAGRWQDCLLHQRLNDALGIDRPGCLSRGSCCGTTAAGAAPGDSRWFRPRCQAGGMRDDPPLRVGYRLAAGPSSVADYLALRERSGLSPRREDQAVAALRGAWAAVHVIHDPQRAQRGHGAGPGRRRLVLPRRGHGNAS